MRFDPVAFRHTVAGLAASLVAGRVIVMTGSAADGRRMASFLVEAGASQVESAALTGAPTSTQACFGYYETSLASPGKALLAQLDAIDPSKAALIYAGSFTSVAKVDGRRVIGGRSPAQAAAERKDAQGSFTNVEGYESPIEDDFRELERPAVIQGIPKVGVAMAASHTYILPPQASKSQLAALAKQLRRDCNQIIVRSLHLGTPCTFYGFVTPKYSVDFGPVKALVYWDRKTWRISAPGILRPLILEDSVLAEARSAVNSTAGRLYQQTGYVGAFGTDGVVRDGKYLIHEINPRVCAGFSLLDGLQQEGVPLAAIDLVLRELKQSAVRTLHEPLSALATAITGDPTVRGLIFDSGQFLPSNVASLDHVLEGVTFVRISDLKEWVA